jgi:hypothetical protein
MFILEMIAALVAAVLVLGGVVNFNRYTARRFGHRFFGWGPLLVGAAAVWAVIGGVKWAQAGSSTEGLALAMGGLAVIALLVVLNVRRTNLVVGLGGSAVQVAAFVVVGLLGAVVAVPALFVAIAAAFGGAEPTMRQTYLHQDAPHY